MVTQGNKVIFGTTFGYMDVMQKLGEEFKDVRFEHATGYKTSENVRTYDSRTYEGALSRWHHRGRHDQDQHPGRGRLGAYSRGAAQHQQLHPCAQSVNPKIKTKVVWVNEWFSPPKETEAARCCR